MQQTHGRRVGLTSVEGIDSQVRVWSFGGKQESQPTVFGTMATAGLENVKSHNG